MRHFLRVAALTTICIGQAAVANTATYPKLFFEYSWLYDDTVRVDKPVEIKWAKEARSREGDFTKIWEKEAPLLFGQLFSDFGKGFQRKELTATLSVCPQSWSYSNPLVLRVLNFLVSYMDPKPTWKDHAFVNQVFHELLHTWLVDNFSFSSPLLEKYKGEPPGVQSHLHLIAIQMQVYTELGRNDLLDWINWLYPNMKSGGEPRAWEIVTKEGYQAFTAELH